MDGWHYPRSTLSTFPNPQEAFDRRGAEWTFDSKRFADFVTAVKNETSVTHTAPSFDHAKKDPLEDDIAVMPTHRVVVFEGLYCNCDVGEWKRAAREFDTRLVFEMPIEEAKRRLVVRHVKTGVAKDEEEAVWRGKWPARLQCRIERRSDADFAQLVSLDFAQPTTMTFRMVSGSCRICMSRIRSSKASTIHPGAEMHQTWGSQGINVT